MEGGRVQKELFGRLRHAVELIDLGARLASKKSKSQRPRRTSVCGCTAAVAVAAIDSAGSTLAASVPLGEKLQQRGRQVKSAFQEICHAAPGSGAQELAR